MIKLSLNQKLISVTVAAFVIIIGLITLNEYQSLKSENIFAKRDRIISCSEKIKFDIMSYMLEERCHDIPHLIKKAHENVNLEKIQILDVANNTILASSQISEVGKRLSEEENKDYLAHRDSEPFYKAENNHPYMIRFLPIEKGKTCDRCHAKSPKVLAVIKIKYSLAESFSSIRHLIFNHLLFSLLAVILFTLVFSYIVMKLIDEPLDGIMETIKHVEEGNYEKQVVIKHYDIIGRLSEKFNRMIAAVNEARKELEKYHQEQMKRASQMAMIGEIAAGIAHEIKNPLACISGALQVIDGDLDEKNEHKPVIQEVINQVKRLDGTVKRILEFAKPARAQKTVLEINETLKETLLFISQFAQKKSIEVKIAAGEGIKKVHGDSKALRQLFLNICLNGIEAMEEKGVLSIVTSMVDKDGPEGKKEYMEILIKDTGMGISEENLVNIFDPFFTTKERGTGLGLSISAQIVEEHGGFMDVESVLTQGTTFKIYLPIANEG